MSAGSLILQLNWIISHMLIQVYRNLLELDVAIC